jgi:hypothetical protein
MHSAEESSHFLPGDGDPVQQQLDEHEEQSQPDDAGPDTSVRTRKSRWPPPPPPRLNMDKDPF